MTDKKEKLADGLPEADKRFYSLNFLLASFTPVDDLERKEAIQQNKLVSRHYQNRDFAVSRFDKNISTLLSQFPPISTEDE